MIIGVREAAAALRHEGVRACFGVTGSGASWQLVTALEEMGIPYCPAGHEAAAAIMAGAFAHQSESLGCSISIKGPGLANMIGGMLSNRYEQWPVLSVAEAYDQTSVSPKMHKRLDHRGLTAPIVKNYASGMDADIIASLARCARAEVPGPVHLDLIAERGKGNSSAHPAGTRHAGQDRAWDEIRRRLDGAKRPMLIVGALASRSSWCARLQTLQVPVFATVAAKGTLDERHPGAAGIFTGAGKSLAPETCIAPEADLVIGLGLRNLEVLTPGPFFAPLIGLDSAGDASLMDGFESCAQLPAATTEQFDSVLDTVSSKPWGTDLVATSVERIRGLLTRDEWLPGSVLATLQAIMGDQARLVSDTGTFCTVAEHVWQATTPWDFMASANGRYMGTSLPMAIGASLARRTLPMLCAMGDGGIRPFWSEIKIAIAERLPICFVLMSDGRYGSVVASASAPGLTPLAVDVPNPSWYKAAAALGCQAHCATSLDSLTKVFNGWRPDDGPYFIELPFEQEAYAAMTADVR